MRGVKSDDLLAIVDFLYCGEAIVFQENLDSFLAIGEELQLKGLIGKKDEKVQKFDIDEKDEKYTLFPALNINSNIHKRPSKNRNLDPRENTTLAIRPYLTAFLGV